jgi:hypothetical protein
MNRVKWNFSVFLCDITEQKEVERRIDITNKLFQMFVQQISRRTTLIPWSGSFRNGAVAGVSE